MIQNFWDFLSNEDAAVTVDWVVLTGAIVGIGLAVISTVGAGASDFATGVAGHMRNGEVKTTY